jgi:hypothetical protein
MKLKITQNECGAASVRNLMGNGYAATIKTSSGETFRATSTSAPWNALSAAVDKWGKSEMARLNAPFTPEGH